MSVLFLTACGKKEAKPEVIVPEGFRGPTSGPDPVKMTPTYSPAEEESGAFDLP